MPYTIKPFDQTATIKGFGTTLTPALKQLGSFEYDPARAWKQIGSSPTLRGTIAGGPSYSRFLDFGSEQKYLPIKPRPALTTSILTKGEEATYQRQLGAIELNLIDPFNTLEQFAGQAGQAVGEENNPLAFLRGAQDFLASKDIDPFGLGAAGAPARAADYALAFPLAIFKQITGRDLSGALPRGEENTDPYYKLHGDPRYWQALIGAAPEQMEQLARQYAARFVDVGANAYVVEQLKRQFAVDRAVATGLSSGNERVDYVAKQELGRQMNPAALTMSNLLSRIGTGGAGLPIQDLVAAIPFAGTHLAEIIDPISPEVEAAWAQLSPADRAGRLGGTNLKVMGTDLIAWLPAFGALGTVMQVARTGGAAARTVASTYNWLLRGSGAVASAGLVAATANWAASAVWKEYAESVGREIDMSRPISGSVLAGGVNQLGYFATGTYGAWGVGKIGARVFGSAAVPAASRLIRGIGHPETPLFTQGFGGAQYVDRMVQAGFDPKGVELAVKQTTYSYVANLVRGRLTSTMEAIANGASVPTHPHLDALPIEERIIAINAELRGSLTGTHAAVKQVFEVLANARKPVALFVSERGRALHAWYQKQARTIDNATAELFFADNGPGWVTRHAGAYDEGAIRAHVQKVTDRLGKDFSVFDDIRGEDNWAKVMRLVHNYEFSAQNAKMIAAASEEVGGVASRELNKISLVSSRHLFNDQAEDVLTFLRGSADPVASKARIADLIENTIEGERWFSSEFKPAKGKPHDYAGINPAKFIAWLEDVQPGLLVRRKLPHAGSDTAGLPLNAFHTGLVDDGLWDIAFKPVDAAGEFVSYIQTRGGKAFQTPWLDYPMGNVDNIELGNRGVVMARYDSVFRSFRSWRIAEFQRGQLYRMLTGGDLHLKATASQIDAFHAGIFTLAYKHSVQPQSLGTVARITGTTGMADELDQLAIDIFGAGPYLNRRGETVTVTWRDVVAKSYRQSLRLNASAGLTSHMKANFGSIGHGAAWASDIGYVAARFHLSPLFKGGEIVESLQLNMMEGVNPLGDPVIEKLFMRNGVGEEHGPMLQEASYDSAILGLGHQSTAQSRQAMGYGFHSLKAPETIAQKAERAAIQVRSEQFQQFVKGGNSIFASPRHALDVELASLVDDAGNILPGMDDRVDEITRILDGTLDYNEVRANQQVGPELPDATWSTDPMDLGGRQSGVAPDAPPEWIDPDIRPEDRGLWHTTTDVDGVHASGLMSRHERVAVGYRAVGLGAMSPDRQVSLTTSYDHAALIETRMRLAVEAAHNKATGKEIIDHFYESYEIRYGEAARTEMAKHVLDVIDPYGVRASVTDVHTFGWMETVLDGVAGKDKYRAVQKLDGQLMFGWEGHYGEAAFDAASTAVGFAGKWEDITLVDPANIGIVQVGIKKGAQWKVGPDYNEVQLRSGDIWTLDKRILDQPLATDKEGLLVQLRQTLRDDGETVIPGFTAYHDEIVDALAKLDVEATAPSVDRLEDLTGTSEFLTESIRVQRPDMLRPGGPWDQPGIAAQVLGTVKRGAKTFANPIPMKERQALLNRIEQDRREFPLLIDAAGLSGFRDVMKQLKVPERDWLPFLMRDRELATAFSASGHADDLKALLDHSGPDPRGQFDALYASEEWSTLTSLFAIADRSAADDAFKVHFFNPYRSALERSLNHPLLGVYPLSWALKVARQWAKFLFDNRTLAGLRLGMTPAVALNQIVRAQNAAFATLDEGQLDEFLDINGPLGSALLVFNLLLPGDWSNLPFLFSRTIRDALRGRLDAGSLGDQVAGFGAPRDVRLLLESGGEIKDFIWGPEAATSGRNAPPPPWAPFTTESVTGSYLRK